MDILLFLRCAETAIALMAMTMAFGILRQRAVLRLVITLIILTASCLYLTAVYQYISEETAEIIHVPMIILSLEVWCYLIRQTNSGCHILIFSPSL
ncbi:hypothetical protein [Acetobacterium bakii]|uniref:hypothetical protein n=1 Tax=Acetobacterium bakii TaxID=52689 RepID=UPI000F8C6DB8|nr:hypothetical protein [Acetobacterium bakii]